MTSSLLLNQENWDLTVDISGNIAVASEPYSLAQDCSCQCKLFLGELFFDQAQGIPYLQQILGKLPSPQFLKAQLQAACLSVPGIASATVFLTSFKDRKVGGQIQLKMTNGATATISTEDISALNPWAISAVSPAAANSPTGGP